MAPPGNGRLSYSGTFRYCSHSLFDSVDSQTGRFAGRIGIKMEMIQKIRGKKSAQTVKRINVLSSDRVFAVA